MPYQEGMTRHYAGELATYDAFLCGEIPCKVLAVLEEGGGIDRNGRVRIKLTAKRKGHKRGEILEVQTGMCIPREHCTYRRGKRIYGLRYHWFKSKPEETPECPQPTSSASAPTT